MQIRQIEIFHAIMLTGSISGAARYLRISQPAATRLLRRAEDQLGYKLFSRVKGRLTATDEAQILFGETQRVMNGFEQLCRLSINLGKSPAGHIRVAATPSLCLDVLPLAIARLRKQNKQATFSIEARLYDELLRVVTAREVDIGFGFNMSPLPGVEVTPVARGAFYGIFPAAEHARLPRRVDVKVFTRYPFIDQLSENPIWPYGTTSIDGAHKELKISSAIGVKNNAIALALVERGAGAAIVDQYTAAAGDPKLVTVRRLNLEFTFSVDLIRASGQPTSYLANQFIAAFKEVANDVADTLAV